MLPFCKNFKAEINVIVCGLSTNKGVNNEIYNSMHGIIKRIIVRTK